jgi:hypothetical protein
MRRKYKACSIWFNEKIISEANQLNLNVFENKKEITEDLIKNGSLKKKINRIFKNIQHIEKSSYCKY